MPSNLVVGELCPFCQSINGIVHDDNCDIEIARCLRSDVLVADAQEVAVARHNYHIEVRASHLYAQRYRE